AELLARMCSFGYTTETLEFMLMPMVHDLRDPLGSMGDDSALAVLSDKPRMLYDYFKQNFAQVTNPPIDPIREELVMSLMSMIGPRPNLLGREAGSHKRLEIAQPILTNEDLAKIRSVEVALDGAFRTATIDTTWDASTGADGLAMAIKEMCWAATEAVLQDHTILILSDREQGPDRIPMPALLATSAVHHQLVRQGLRMQTGLVVETGEAREVHHFCALAGYGAEAINPYVAFETLENLRATKLPQLDAKKVEANFVKAVGKGILKVMSKMGISTYQSYCGAQIFDAVGLAQDFVDDFFTGTATTIGGAGLAEIAEEAVLRHGQAYGDSPLYEGMLDVGGIYQYRLRGEDHAWTPESVANLQHAVRGDKPDNYAAYAKAINEQSERLLTIRGLMELKPADQPIPLDEVEPAAEIVKRFSTGAMSYGSISREAHTTLAIAMNRLGGKSNTGEGGEDPERLYDPERRSSIKQVASGRFGVTSEYLSNADDIQIKMAQGAKPGEGGQLPGPKVYPWVAKTRHSTPGVGLISPPPHHDIYSIEDLKQLIHDLKNANPSARVHVKLVSEVGVGTVAAGVSKAKADVVLISGHDGGTGASPLTSLKHAGGPWELGLAETQQTLLVNGLRDRIVVQCDGQLKTGRDVVVAALLGAEEFGFATAPLVVSGCIMMRVCHLDTCPVGVATQNRQLREKFSGKAEYVVNFFEFLAQEVREYLAELGFRSIDEAVGHAEVLDVRQAVDHWKAQHLDLSPILYVPELPEGASLRNTSGQEHGLDVALDAELIRISADALERGEPVRAQLPIRNVNRTVGTMLGHELTKRYRGEGLPENTIDLTFLGSAGQSFGAFVPRGITLRLEGDGNDYVGKGLSGGRLVVRPPRDATFAAEAQIVAGNVIGFGATSGEIFLRGKVGERFCVRNSGASAVVEGVGDHALEYMTGGTVVILGPTGRNVAAGMSGGQAYVLDLDHSLVNPEMVALNTVEAGSEAAEALHALVVKHHEETGSAVAEQLLGAWEQSLARFTEVMPVNYRKVLDAKAEAEAEGLSEDDTTARMMEVAARG
ncbi:glutamate synthase large subunit, partial [Aeromicrobium sp. REDSEA-S38_B2]|uniref:glutamate synthase large subunit n=1 Tax=Aeromicrobium sp. REDSEA-S38_B2 TaxID=1811528 RepID=UPI00338F078E